MSGNGLDICTFTNPKKHISEREDRIMIAMFFVILLSFVLIFILSLLEFVWCAVQDKDVVAYEQSRGGPNAATRAVKALLRERMVEVNFILLLIHLITYFTPMLLGILTRSTDGWVMVMLVAYGVVLFFGGELTAKNLGYRWMTSAAVYSAITLKLLLHCCAPVTWVLRCLISLTGGHELRLCREEDVIATARVAQEHGALGPQETMLIRKAIELGNLKVGDVFMPVAKVLTVPLRPTQQQLSNAASKHSHVIVCSDDKTIIGSLTRKEVVAFLARDIPHDQPIDLPRDSIHGMLDLPQTMPIAEAFEFLRGDVVCEVTDDQGRTIGVIRTRDVAFRLFETQIENGH